MGVQATDADVVIPIVTSNTVHFERNGDCVKICGRITVPDVDRLVTYGAAYARIALAFDLVQNPVPLGALACVTGLWSCCTRSSTVLTGFGVSNSGPIVGAEVILGALLGQGLLRLTIRNNWTEDIRNPEVHFDDMAFELCGELDTILV